MFLFVNKNTGILFVRKTIFDFIKDSFGKSQVVTAKMIATVQTIIVKGLSPVMPSFAQKIERSIVTDSRVIMNPEVTGKSKLTPSVEAVSEIPVTKVISDLSAGDSSITQSLIPTVSDIVESESTGGANILEVEDEKVTEVTQAEPVNPPDIPGK